MIEAIIALVLGALVGFFLPRKSRARRRTVDDAAVRLREYVKEQERVAAQREKHLKEILEDVDEKLEDSAARERTPEESIRILRDRYGWGPTDDRAP